MFSSLLIDCTQCRPFSPPWLGFTAPHHEIVTSNKNQKFEYLNRFPGSQYSHRLKMKLHCVRCSCCRPLHSTEPRTALAYQFNIPVSLIWSNWAVTNYPEYISGMKLIFNGAHSVHLILRSTAHVLFMIHWRYALAARIQHNSHSSPGHQNDAHYFDSIYFQCTKTIWRESIISHWGGEEARKFWIWKWSNGCFVAKQRTNSPGPD